MRQLFIKLRNFVYSRSGDEWKSFFLSYVTEGRLFIKENGEKAAAIAFLLGILLVLFLKLVVILLMAAVVVVVGIIIWADNRPTDWKSS